MDVVIEGPSDELIYSQTRSQFDSHQFTTKAEGVHTVCFSNEFSTFSHKVVYMDFQVGEENPLANIDAHAEHLTQLESSAQEIHKSLNAILDYQTHHRLVSIFIHFVEFFYSFRVNYEHFPFSIFFHM